MESGHFKPPGRIPRSNACTQCSLLSCFERDFLQVGRDLPRLVVAITCLGLSLPLRLISWLCLCHVVSMCLGMLCCVMLYCAMLLLCCGSSWHTNGGGGQISPHLPLLMPLSASTSMMPCWIEPWQYRLISPTRSQGPYRQSDPGPVCQRHALPSDQTPMWVW